MKFRPFIAALLLLVSATPSLIAQNETSPYSRFGYGILRDNATSAQRQMGGVGYAMHSGRQVNAMNPAAYAAMDSLTFLFDMGVDASIYWRQDDYGRKHDWGGGIDYITMQFPVTRYIGVSAGLVPYSSVGYSFGSDIENGASTHQGLGGINQLYVGAGITPFKNFRVGFNVSYLFGNIFNDVYATSNLGSQSLFEQAIEVHDYHFLFGAQYTLVLSQKNSVSLGLTWAPGKTLLGKTYVEKYDTTQDSEPEIVEPGRVSLKNRFSLPYSLGAGISYSWNSRLLAEVDFTYQPWSKAKYEQIENFSATRLADRWKVAGGASYTPDPRGNYFKRISYRAGAFYNRDYVMVGDNHVRDWGVSCGFGLPAASSKTVINLGAEYHNRQATPNPLLKEKYFSITLGINFNQVWFFQNKLR